MENSIIIKSNLAKLSYHPNQTKIFNSKRLTIIFFGIMGVISACLYVPYEADNMQEYIISALVIVISIGTFISYIDTSLKTSKIFSLIDIREKILNKRLICSSMKATYIKTNRILEKICKILNYSFYMLVSGTILPKAIYSLYLYFTTDLGTDALKLPLPLWFPFYSKNAFGYLAAILAQHILGFILVQYVFCFVAMAFTGFLFATIFARDLKNDLHSVNENVNIEASESDIMKQLIVFIDMHSDVKQLANDFAEVYQNTIVILFSGSVVAICMTMSLVQVQMSTDVIDITFVVESAVFGFFAFMLVFFSTEIGQRFSNSFEEIDDEINQMDWYLLPIKIQRVLPTIMMNTQIIMAIPCFGSLDSNRETFKKVINKGYSFFMVLREFI